MHSQWEFKEEVKQMVTFDLFVFVPLRINKATFLNCFIIQQNGTNQHTTPETVYHQ